MMMTDIPQEHTHYEYVIDSKETETTNDSKEDALRSLNELQGWCTPLKATILMDLIYSVKPNVVVEIGVFGGSSLIPMAYALRDIGNGTIYGIDPWTQEASVQGMEGIHELWWGSMDHEAILTRLVNKIAEYSLDKQIQLIRETSEDAPLIQPIDFLHIDGNHSDEASYIDVTKWVPLVRRGGIIIFDDMTWGTTTRAVNWLDKHCDKLAEIEEENVWGIWIKK